MEDYLKRILLLLSILIAAAPSGLWAQQGGYFQTNLVSNTVGIATTTDPQLLNPWESRFFPVKISGSPTITAVPPRFMT
jgi:hypothetical protein